MMKTWLSHFRAFLWCTIGWERQECLTSTLPCYKGNLSLPCRQLVTAGLGDKLHLCNFPGEVQASQLRLILLLCDIVCQSCAEIPVLLLWLHFAICL